jgi:signal transduction histidine kinase
MLKKLKIKFVLTNLLLITIVLAVFFSTLYINLTKNIKQESISALESFVILPERDMGKQGYNDKPSENKFLTPNENDMKFNASGNTSIFCVKLDMSENLISVYNYKENLTSKNKETLENYAKKALKTGKREGVISFEDISFRYNVKHGVRHAYISFLDTREEIADVRKFVEGFYFILAASLVAVLIISIILANVAIRPVKKAWQQQKQFIADASHELKTPLTVIISSTDIMMSDMSDAKPEHKKWLECTRTEADRMKELISDMLYLARSDDENVKMGEGTHRVFNLSDVLTESLLNFEIQCYEKGKTLNQEVEEDIYIKGNETEIRQLMGIFLDNAQKYSNENGTIDVSLKSNGGKCLLSFKNTGEPISPRDIPHLFERFYRASASRSREEGGYGLGLSIAETIATKHETKISVTSNSDYTEFSIRFNKESGNSVSG